MTIYSLVAIGLRAVSVSSRHLAVGTTSAFCVAPIILNAADNYVPVPIAMLISLIVCFGYGVLYQVITAFLSKRGARESSLLLVSLAILGISENALSMILNGESMTTMNPRSPIVHLIGTLRVSFQDILCLLISVILLAILPAVKTRTWIGVQYCALKDSRTHLALSGVDIHMLERILAGVGCSIIALSGIVWSASARITSTMCTEYSIIGTVVMLSATSFARGAIGFIVSGAILACSRLLLQLFFNDSWTMTAVMITFLSSLLWMRIAWRPRASG